MTAIIYESNTGFTKRYAEILAEKLNIPCYSLKESKKNVSKGADVIFLGWVFANKIVGYGKAVKRFDVKAVGAVGINPESDTNTQIVKDANKPTCPLFYLHGGLDYSKLKGLKKKMMLLVRDNLASENKPENKDAVMLLTTGGDFVSEEKLAGLITLAMML